MQIIDNDLLSIQEARILTELARDAQKEIAGFSQEKLDDLIDRIARVMLQHADTLAEQSVVETDFGVWQDKTIKNRFVCEVLPRKLKDMRCVGIIHEDDVEKTVQVGVPKGIVLAICPPTNPVSTIIYNAMISIKSGNAVIFALHKRAKASMQQALDLMIAEAEASGFPKGSIAYLNTIADAGAVEVMNSAGVATILMTDTPHLLESAYQSGKQVMYGSMGNNPVFIEKTADVQQAVRDIITSKTFDHGILPGVEQSLVVDAAVADQVRHHLIAEGAYFMNAEEERALAKHLFDRDCSYRAEMIGKSAQSLARRSGFEIPANATVLIAEAKYVSHKNLFAGVKYGPVLAYFVEDGWQHACEKCIELLIGDGNGHSLSIHSKDPSVVMQFALKKPVGRMLVNSPAALGSVGMTTNLFPALTLGSATSGAGITSDNISPMNLVYVRQIAYGVRTLDRTAVSMLERNRAVETPAASSGPCWSPEMAELLCQLLRAAKGDPEAGCNLEEMQALYQTLQNNLQQS